MAGIFDDFAPPMLWEQMLADEARETAAKRTGRRGPKEEGLLTKLLDALGGIPKGMVGAAAGMVDAAKDAANEQTGNVTALSTDYDPRRLAATLGAETAMNVVGTPALTGGMPGLGSGASKIRAYHGSPHDFDRFDLSKIGTGEGAQSYGHGLYFAENPKVAEAYKLDPKMNMYARKEEWTPVQEAVAELFYANKQDVGVTLAEMNKRIANTRMYADSPESLAALKEERDLLAGGWHPPRSKMYEVNINAAPEQFLDWDKPLRDQPGVRGGIESLKNEPALPRGFARELDRVIASDRFDGDDLYREIVRAMPNEKAASTLKNAGIPGIKYLDQGSRGYVDPKVLQQRFENAERSIAEWNTPESKAQWVQGPESHAAFVKTYEDEAVDLRKQIAEAQSIKPTSNYVVFDDKIIDILRKYGLLGTLGGLGGLGGLKPEQELTQ